MIKGLKKRVRKGGWVPHDTEDSPGMQLASSVIFHKGSSVQIRVEPIEKVHVELVLIWAVRRRFPIRGRDKSTLAREVGGCHRILSAPPQPLAASLLASGALW
ncbi:hypothetical protein Pfo_017650 [Paulownia fortunei]|nr:hypothetical protein Pfo_017650 [Paulownia fortunei]